MAHKDRTSARGTSWHGSSPLEPRPRRLGAALAGGLLATLALGCGSTVTVNGFVGKPNLSPTEMRIVAVSIRENPPKEMVKLYREMAHEADEAGAPEAVRNMLTSRAEGQGFGSGFVVVRDGGSGLEPFFITNHHVIEASESVDVTLDDGLVLSACKVIYSDAFRDLAVVTCNNAQASRFPWGLTPAATATTDQEEVVAVGFPALDGKPAYQSTLGHVSNSRYEDKEKRHFVQHTAPIDPGSSGGPLMSKDGGLIGVNTIKVMNRDNVYFAVPAADVWTAVDKALETRRDFSTADTKRSLLGKACTRLADEVASKDFDPQVLTDYVSNDMLAARGVESFQMLFSVVTGDTKEMLGTMFLLNPMDAMRSAIMLRMRVEVAEAGGSIDCGHINSSDDAEMGRDKPVRVAMKIGPDRHESKWVVEHGKWRLADFEY